MAPNYNPKLLAFLKAEKMTDVTLTAEGKTIRAHKLMLAAASTYFEELFVALPDKHPVIVLKDIPVKLLVLMLEYVYCGQVDLNPSDVEAFNAVAKSLKINVEFKVPEDLKASLTDDQSMSEGSIDDSFQSKSPSVSNSSLKPSKSKPKQTRSKQAKVSQKMLKEERKRLAIAEGWPTCKFCEIAFRRKHLNYHQKICVKNPDREVTKCSICNIKCYTPLRLRAHMKSVHPTETSN